MANTNNSAITGKFRGTIGKELVFRDRTVERLAKEQARAIGIGGEELDGRVEDGVEAILPRHGAQEARHDLVPARQEVLEDAAMQRLLRREVIEQRRLGHADGVGDLLDGGAVDALGGEQASRFFQDLGPHVHSAHPTSRSHFVYQMVDAPASQKQIPREIRRDGQFKMVFGFSPDLLISL